MTDKTSNDPLHGKTLEMIVKHLVYYYGWDHLGTKINIRCFNENPSIKSSLTFLRKNTLGKKKVEDLYISVIEKE